MRSRVIGGRACLEPFLEFEHDLLVCGNGALHPWVHNDLLQSDPLGWIRIQHLEQKIFEFITDRRNLVEQLPINVWSVGCHMLVEVVSDDGLLERFALRDHHEQRYGEREDVGLLAVVAVRAEHLGGHVAFGSLELGQGYGLALAVCDLGAESEVVKLQVQVRIHQDVFKLDVPVANSHRVVQIMDCAEELSEIVPSCSFREFSGRLHNLEEFTILDIVHDDVEDFSWFGTVEPVEGTAADSLDADN